MEFKCSAYNDYAKTALFKRLLMGIISELATTIVPNVLYRGVRLYPQNQGQHSPLVAFFTDCRDVAFLYAKYPPYAVYFRNFEHGTQVIDFTNVGNIQKIVDIANEAGLPDIFTDFAAIDNAANTSFEHDVFCLFPKFLLVIWLDFIVEHFRLPWTGLLQNLLFTAT
jgi:hypothetical protein